MPDSLFNKKKPVTNIESDEEIEISDHDSDEEYDELDIEIKTIDDLIKLGKEFEKIESKPNEQASHEKDNSNARRSYFEQKDPRDLLMRDFDTYSRHPKGYSSKSGLRADLRDTISSNVDNKVRYFKDEPIAPKFILTKDGKIKCLKPIEPSKIPIKSEPKIAKTYIVNGKKYNINLEILYKLVKPLTKLQSMIGLDKVKIAVIDMILYYLQSFEKRNNDMLHTVIEGPPGVGKTQLGMILAEIYAGLGVIKSNKFKLVKRSELVGEYMGHTAPKTQKIIDEADGGVLFIDEAYALGSEDKKDSFNKECIDTINQNLSEKKRNFICIIAGYPDELDKCFFSYNPGLKRRFSIRYAIDGYNSSELKNIFVKKVKDIKWQINETSEMELSELFDRNKDKFPYFGGDIETYLLNCKFVHSRRVFGKHPKNKRKLNMQDLKTGLDRFVLNKKKESVLSYFS
jgi:hypothetical protein